jgi:hypothetical protein
MIGEFLIALVVAMLLTVAFAAMFDATGPWSGFWAFFVVTLLVAWAAGVWVRPFGPPLWGIYWAPYLTFGLIAALIVAAATPRRRPRAGPVPRRRPIDPPGVPGSDPAGRAGTVRVEAEDLGAEEEAVAVGAFAWTLVVLLLIVVIVGYVL